MWYESVIFALRKEACISSRLQYYVLFLNVLLGSVKDSYVAFDLVGNSTELMTVLNKACN